jgi:tRNA-Thr(GGU) m(6)t(6)A37 methyltransferase TsaA
MKEPLPHEREAKTMKRRQLLFGLLAASALSGALWAGEPAEKTFTLHPIGQVHKEADRMVIVLDKKYQDGLLGLDQWSHVQVVWWFDKNDTSQKRAVLQVHPRGNPQNPLTGVFACRAPVRPNLIALSLCKIVLVKDNVVEIEKIDADEGTPVLDLKPYAPGQDSASDVKVPKWAGPSGDRK